LWVIFAHLDLDLDCNSPSGSREPTESESGSTKLPCTDPTTSKSYVFTVEMKNKKLNYKMFVIHNKPVFKKLPCCFDFTFEEEYGFGYIKNT
jgi:hypothetical protein